jgi:hypothetical protein
LEILDVAPEPEVLGLNEKEIHTHTHTHRVIKKNFANY